MPQAIPLLDWDVSTPGVKKLEVVPGPQLYGHCRVARNGRVAVSLALQNPGAAKGDLRDGCAWFRVGLEVTSPESAIVDRSSLRCAW